MLRNPTGRGLRSDSVGCGYFGAPRGGRPHAGIDLLCTSGQPVVSPIYGLATRTARPYANDSRWLGIYIDGMDQHKIFAAKLFYMFPDVDYPTYVKPGDSIGYAQDISLKYDGCLPHVHLEIYIKPDSLLGEHGMVDEWTRIDPYPLLGP